MKQTLFAVFLIATLAGIGSQAAKNDVKDKEAFVNRAQAAYYNLPRLGVTGYRCEAVTDWLALLGNVMAPDALKSESAQKGLKALETIHIWMTVDKSGDPRVMHKVGDFSGNAQAQELVAKLVQKQESLLTHTAHDLRRQLFTGMFPLPDESYTLEEKDGRYLISLVDGRSHGTLRIGQDLKIMDFTVSLPDGTVTITPQYMETAQGFLFTGQRIETHTNLHDSGTDTESLEYSDIGGVRIPTKITSVILLDRAPDKKPRQVVVLFQDCQLQKAN